MKSDIVNYMKNSLGIDDEETSQAIYQDYLDTVRASLDEIKADIEAKNQADLRHSAHSLKGCSANVGAEPLRELSLAIENAAKQNDFELAHSCFEQLKETADALFAEA